MGWLPTTGHRRQAWWSVAVLVVAVACTSPGSNADLPEQGPPTDAPVPTPTTTTAASTTTTDLAPITGYGDFSQYDFNEFDDLMVMERIAACVSDQGFPMTFDPEHGMELEGQLTDEQSTRITDVIEACARGLNIPEREMTRTELLERYEFFLAAAACLRAAGFDIPPAPSFDTWAETWPLGYWQPADYLPDSALGDGIQVAGCPIRYRVGWQDLMPPAP